MYVDVLTYIICIYIVIYIAPSYYVYMRPIPIRGRRGEQKAVPPDAQAALARAVASLLGDGSSASAVSAAVQAASTARGPLQEELVKALKWTYIRLYKII